jgi:prepilin-type N-terminal cleavage/methylation domain-containing protein
MPEVRVARRGRAVLRHGFTLIEMMVAIAISSVTVTLLYNIFSAQTRQLVSQDLHMEMHQNLRFAADMITRTVRMAGYGTPGSVTGVMGASFPTAGSQDDALPVMMSWNNDSITETDALTVVYADPSLLMDTRNDVIESCDATSLNFRPLIQDHQEKLGQFAAGELIMCFDYADMSGMKSYMWELSADANTLTGEVPITANTAHLDYASACPDGQNLPPIMTCSKAHVLTFYVDDTADDGVGPGSAETPVLMLDLDMAWPDANDVPLVDHIEDLQFEYCLDDGGKDVDCDLKHRWDDEFDSDDATWVWMVRTSLVARSSREELTGNYESIRPGLADHREMKESDATAHYRQTLVTEVSVRNTRYQVSL